MSRFRPSMQPTIGRRRDGSRVLRRGSHPPRVQALPVFPSRQIFDRGVQFPVEGPPMPESVSMAVMTAAFEVSSRRVAQLADEGVVVRTARGRFDLIASTANYCRRLREVASGRGQDAPDLTAERTRLAKEQADGKAIENELRRGHLIDAEAAGRRWDDEIVKLRSRLLAVPGDVALALPHLTKHDLAEVDRVLRDAMTAIADGAA